MERFARTGLRVLAGCTLSSVFCGAALALPDNSDGPANETRWFLILNVTVVFVLWVLFLLRLRQVKARLRRRLEERLVERERIARELHDTFLQGVQGVMLRFQSAMERIPPTEPARALMEEALDRADRVLADGRDAVINLERDWHGVNRDLE